MIIYIKKDSAFDLFNYYVLVQIRFYQISVILKLLYLDSHLTVGALF